MSDLQHQCLRVNHARILKFNSAAFVWPVEMGAWRRWPENCPVQTARGSAFTAGTGCLLSSCCVKRHRTPASSARHRRLLVDGERFCNDKKLRFTYWRGISSAAAQTGPGNDRHLTTVVRLLPLLSGARSARRPCPRCGRGWGGDART